MTVTEKTWPVADLLALAAALLEKSSLDHAKAETVAELLVEAAIFAGQIGMSGKKRGDLGLHRLRQQLARAVAQNIGERIGEVSRLA